MRNGYLSRFLALALALMPLVPLHAYADEELEAPATPEMQEFIIDGVMKFFAHQYGITPDSREGQYLLAKFRESAKPGHPYVEEPDPDQSVPQVIKPIQTLRLGLGDPLPPAKELDQKQEAILDTFRQQQESQPPPEEIPHIPFMEAMIKETERFVQPPPEIADCEKNDFIKNELPSEFDRAEFNRDMLVVGERYPFDQEEAFGKGVQILNYTNQVGDLHSLSIAHAGLECLPFRMRIQSGVMYRFYGDRALYNFEESANGRPAPIVREYLKSRKKGLL